MPTHAQGSDVVEEDHTEVAVGGVRWNQQRTHEHIGTPWFVDHRRTESVELATQPQHALRERTGSQVRPAGDHHASRFAAGMGIHDLNAMKVCHWISDLSDVRVLVSWTGRPAARQARHSRPTHTLQQQDSAGTSDDTAPATTPRGAQNPSFSGYRGGHSQSRYRIPLQGTDVSGSASVDGIAGGGPVGWW